eukprot:TRINITY_DN39737_c0_g1_i1.p1 TRINITY_DN39737_c0_g1~~TRINITY_DN39737_c0_g1_i1.p1  ORF type:complete len:111 (-),score=14.99 TRINITY_DN39737_c0_g1_i1:275-607(-)
MAGLQRSSVSFRRQGSSGLVWEDRLLSESDSDPTQTINKEDDPGSQSNSQRPTEPTAVIIERSRSGGGRTWRTGKVSPAIDPPSPKLSTCGFCGVFGKPSAAKQPNPRKR